jgi:hypothetical protein
MLPIIYDFILNGTIRYTRAKKIYNLACKKAFELGLPLLIFTNPNHGIINYYYENPNACDVLCQNKHGCKKCKESFDGPIIDIIPKLKNNSVVIFLSFTMEFVENDQIEYLLNELNKVSKNIFMVNIEKASSKLFLSEGIEQYFDKSYYLSHEFSAIKFKKITNIHKNLNKIYKLIFKILPIHNKFIEYEY